jgi:hypothetical protein
MFFLKFSFFNFFFCFSILPTFQEKERAKRNIKNKTSSGLFFFSCFFSFFFFKLKQKVEEKRKKKQKMKILYFHKKKI